VATRTPERKKPIKKLSPRRQALQSTIALKALMAISGLIMIGYLLLHMYGVLKAFSGREAFNEYSSYLHNFGAPLLPYDGFFWILRVILLAAIGAHIYSAVVLTRRDWKARTGVGKRYQTVKRRGGLQRSYSSFTLRWGGVVIFLYVIFHLLNLTTNHIHPGGATPSPYDRLVNSFSVWWVVAIYTIALLAVGFHIRHGVWSALTTLGANTSKKARWRLNVLAYASAGAIAVGFIIVPWSVVFGWITA
jgi:succinate dehydrogenase / fumarate reductase cytochrome b subunit